MFERDKKKLDGLRRTRVVMPPPISVEEERLQLPVVVVVVGGHCQLGRHSTGPLGRWAAPTLSHECPLSQEAQPLCTCENHQAAHSGLFVSLAESLLSKTSLGNNVHRCEAERPGQQ